MTNHALDATETHLVILKPETQHVAECVAGQLVHAAAGRTRSQRLIDEAADAYHAHAARAIAHEHMLIAIDAHDDDAVITQLVDIEIIATDAAAERGDQ